jgi:hypothetical protein
MFHVSTKGHVIVALSGDGEKNECGFTRHREDSARKVRSVPIIKRFPDSVASARCFESCLMSRPLTPPMLQLTFEGKS